MKQKSRNDNSSYYSLSPLGPTFQSLSPQLHILQLFEGWDVDIVLLDPVPEASLVDPQKLGRADLDAPRPCHCFDDHALFYFRETVIEGS